MNFFESIVNFFQLIWDLITGFLSGLLTMFSMIASSTVAPTHFASFLPSLLAASVFSVMGVGVIKLILGR